jgi:hypothetical protein
MNERPESYSHCMSLHLGVMLLRASGNNMSYKFMTSFSKRSPGQSCRMVRTSVFRLCGYGYERRALAYPNPTAVVHCGTAQCCIVFVFPYK